MPEALISIKPKYTKKIIEGNKTVEIRTRKVVIPENTKLWIYSTLPKASIQAFVYVKKIDIGSPYSIWEKHSEELGISKHYFDSYVNGSENICAIVTERVSHLPFEITLSEIRRKVPNFNPPQFYKYLKEGDPLLLAIKNILLKDGRS